VDFIELLDSLACSKEKLLNCCLIHDFSAYFDCLFLRYHNTTATIARTGSLLSGLLLFRIMNIDILDFLVKSPKLHHEESISILLGEALRELLVTVVA
jgi:hypothetical protein